LNNTGSNKSTALLMLLLKEPMQN